MVTRVGVNDLTKQISRTTTFWQKAAVDARGSEKHDSSIQLSGRYNARCRRADEPSLLSI